MNVENINKVIQALRDDRDKPVQHFRMGNFAAVVDYRKKEQDGYQVCNTAMCVAGWANTIRMLENNDPRLKTDMYFCVVDDRYAAADWLGISKNQALHIFFMEKNENVGDGSGQTALEMFDAADKANRYAAAIEMLEHLRDTGEASWQRALRNHNLAEIADEIDEQVDD